MNPFLQSSKEKEISNFFNDFFEAFIWKQSILNSITSLNFNIKLISRPNYIVSKIQSVNFKI